jgi:hypothetical protein
VEKMIGRVVKTDVEIQWIRLLLALTFAAIPPAFFLNAVTFAGGEDKTRSAAVMATIAGASWFLLLAGTPLLIVATKRLSGIHLHKACYLLGAGAVFLLPLVSVTAIIYGAPMLIPTAKSGVAMPVAACLGGGLLGQPYGWLAGWMVWRLGFPIAAARDTGRFSRSWSNLGKTRLMLSLCLLTLLPAAVFLAGLFYFPTRGFVVGPSRTLLVTFTALIGSTALILATIGGAAFLYTNSRGRQGRVSLASCLALGCGFILLLPFACNAMVAGFSALSPAVSDVVSDGFVGVSVFEDFTFFLAVGTILTPLGLPGGWLLWQIGIAPAPRSAPLESDIPAFD